MWVDTGKAGTTESSIYGDVLWTMVLACSQVGQRCAQTGGTPGRHRDNEERDPRWGYLLR